MENYYLAVDIGASSGRHIIAWQENGKINMEEIYRFENKMVKKDGHLCWEVDRLFDEILNGMRRCREIGKIPVSMGIDTWAVDYVLLDDAGEVLGNTYGYRDYRTQGIDEIVEKIIPLKELYARTGIQKQIFNTIYQIMAHKEQESDIYEKASHLLLIPDYFIYQLTGKIRTEYTNATTTQLVSPVTKDWDYELIEMLGLRTDMFSPIVEAGSVAGGLLEEIEKKVGYNLSVINVASHDTASAVAAVPALTEDFVYISSGTWSLMGVEQMQANCSKECQAVNLTNEGGYQYRYRMLKNIMGLWMIQSVRHEWNDEYTFTKLCEMARENEGFESSVDVNDARFLAPDSMIDAICKVCEENNQPVPKSPGEVAAVIYGSLAQSYKETVCEIEKITGKEYDGIYIVGGGANADYLNQKTADFTGKNVYSGPGEATALGNIIVQMISGKEYDTLSEARKNIFDSFTVKAFKPENMK